MLQEYIEWAKKNGGMTDDQIMDFKDLAGKLDYEVNQFAQGLLQYKIPAADIINCMRKGLAKRQSEAKPKTA